MRGGFSMTGSGTDDQGRFSKMFQWLMRHLGSLLARRQSAANWRTEMVNLAADQIARSIEHRL